MKYRTADPGKHVKGMYCNMSVERKYFKVHVSSIIKASVLVDETYANGLVIKLMETADVSDE